MQARELRDMAREERHQRILARTLAWRDMQRRVRIRDGGEGFTVDQVHVFSTMHVSMYSPNGALAVRPHVPQRAGAP